MLAKVTVCPFQDPEHLSICAERGIIETNYAWLTDISVVSNSGLGKTATSIDDLDMARINAAVSETLRSTICIYCDTNNQCHPA